MTFEETDGCANSKNKELTPGEPVLCRLAAIIVRTKAADVGKSHNP